MRYIPGKGYVVEDAPRPSEAAIDDRRLINSAKQAHLDRKDLVQSVTRRCIECAYDPRDTGSALDQVARCEVTTCALYPYRPRTLDGQDAELITANRKDSQNLRTKDSLIRRCQKAGTVRSAINGYCADCIYDAAEPGNWRQQVTACTDRNCDLYIVRPKTGTPMPELEPEKEYEEQPMTPQVMLLSAKEKQLAASKKEAKAPYYDDDSQERNRRYIEKEYLPALTPRQATGSMSLKDLIAYCDPKQNNWKGFWVRGFHVADDAAVVGTIDEYGSMSVEWFSHD